MNTLSGIPLIIIYILLYIKRFVLHYFQQTLEKEKNFALTLSTFDQATFLCY